MPTDPTHRQGNTKIPPLITRAVSDLNPYHLGALRPIDPGYQAELLDLADSTIVNLICTAASNLLQAPQDEILEITAAHSSSLLNYFAVRALILDESPSPYDDPDYL